MPNLDQDHLAWLVRNGRTIFLDTAKDRYFRLPSDRDREFRTRLSHEGAEDWRQPADLPRPAKWALPQIAFDPATDARFSLSGVAAAIWFQRRIEHRLASRGLQAVLLDLIKVLPENPSAEPDWSAFNSIVLAFEHAKLLRTAANRCLPRSLALVTRLASLRIRAELVIGVRNDPFGAHSWAQHNGVVLNDSLEETRRYEPILVV